ncbi:MAG: OmpH family outer membrane protein [Victivallales bacterium]|nr:OmpH family outer membrane protein [Victivallales bacterium]
MFKIRIKKILPAAMAVAVFTVIAGDPAPAAAPKLALIDMDMVFHEYYKTKETDAVLRQKQGIYQAWAKKLGESKLKLEEEFKILRDASQNIAYSSAEREKKRLAAQNKYQELKKKEAELEQYVEQKSREYKELLQKMYKKILEEIYTEIKRYAVLKGYTMVMDKSGKSLNTVPVIIYNSPQLDITQDILKRLNRGQPVVDGEEAK